jgi:hypothetical protein
MSEKEMVLSDFVEAKRKRLLHYARDLHGS